MAKPGARKRTAYQTGRPVTDRVTTGTNRRAPSLDGLTGAYRRGAGMLEIVWEVARAKRTQQPLVLAFVGVDGLHATNERSGRAAGDELLRTVADTLRAHLRACDFIVRFGGDELLCAIPGLSLEAAAVRFGGVNGALTSLAAPASITVGLTELRADDSIDDLVARADSDSARTPRPVIASAD
jgi:diguanylate cyclase (GGDEF)-like protein